MAYELEKVVWTDEDFARMGWHDATVYAAAILPESFELVLDIDYILKWVDPVPPSRHFSFWVSPATLAFQGVQDVEGEISIRHIEHLTLQDIHRGNPRPTPTGGLTDWDWKVELHQGMLTFRAHGFSQFFRRTPIHVNGQTVGVDRRGGVSFGREFVVTAA